MTTQTKPLTFIPKMQEQKKETILAVAWIAAREGGYETSNVAASIGRALSAEGYKVDQDRIVDAMRWLDSNGYAARSVLGRRHIMFVMDPDVTFPDPGFVRAKKARAEGAVARSTRHAGGTATNGTSPAPVVPAPPARPPLPDRKPPWIAELSMRLTAWHRDDPAAATAWANEVMETLR